MLKRLNGKYFVILVKDFGDSKLDAVVFHASVEKA